jgi:YD repeat-containing protein
VDTATGAGTLTRSYDGLDRLTSETTPKGTVSATYDTASRRATMTVTGQTQVTYTYDNADRLTQVVRGSNTMTLTYDNANRTLLGLPAGVVDYAPDVCRPRAPTWALSEPADERCGRIGNPCGSTRQPRIRRHRCAARGCERSAGERASPIASSLGKSRGQLRSLPQSDARPRSEPAIRPGADPLEVLVPSPFPRVVTCNELFSLAKA